MTVLAPYRALLAGRLFLCVPAQSSVQAVQRDVTSISLRRIDRACYQDRCDVHSDTSDDTDSPTRRAAKTLSTRATRSRPHSKPVEPSARNRRWRAGRGPGRRSWLENASRGRRVGPRRASARKVSTYLTRSQPVHNPAQPKKHDSQVGPSGSRFCAKVKKERKKEKGWMGGRHAATTQGF